MRANQKLVAIAGVVLLAGVYVLLLSRKRRLKPESDSGSIFSFWAGKAKIIGDIVAPAVDPEEWAEVYQEWDELDL